MKDDQLIKKLINDCHIQTDPSVDQRVMAEALDRFDQNPEKSSPFAGPSIWRIIMNRPLMKLGMATVVVALVALMAVIWILPQFETHVYALTEVMDELKSVQTLYFRGTNYLYNDQDGNDSGFETATIVPRECWLDVPNMKERFISFESWSTPDGMCGLNRIEGVRSAEIALDIDHTRKNARYNRLSPVRRRLEVRSVVEQFLDVESAIIQNFELVGQQRFEGVDIWQWEGPKTHDPTILRKIQYWVSPATGYLVKKLDWFKDIENGPWRLGSITDEIRINEPIDEAQFTMTVPEGYRCQPTLEEAILGEGLGMGWYGLGNARVCNAISFVLDDGTIITAWHSDDLQVDRYVDQSHLFKDLMPGGPLPKLPMVIFGIRTVSIEPYTGPEVRYTGYHLAHTQKDGWYYEWAFYVPHSEPIPKGTQSVIYRQLCAFNLKEPQESREGNPLHRYWIEPSEFDVFVRGAMAELSDDGEAPEYVTYDYVLELSEQARSMRVQ